MRYPSKKKLLLAIPACFLILVLLSGLSWAQDLPFLPSLQIGVEQAEGSTLLQDFNLGNSEKIALIFGNEVTGISEEVMDQINECIEVPQYGTKHSLNIAVCIGVVVWEIFKKWKF